MIVSKVSRIVGNPARKGSSSGQRSNPAHLITMGFINPNKGASMAQKKKKKSGAHHAHRSRNPFSFFGSSAKPKTVVKAAAGVLVGVGVTRTLVNIVPASFTSSNITHTLTAAALALLEWWGFSMVDPDFGAAVGLGGLAYAGNAALNSFMPQAGQYIGISGVRRGTGDLIKAHLNPYPQLPGSAGIGSVGVRKVYPSAYGRVA